MNVQQFLKKNGLGTYSPAGLVFLEAEVIRLLLLYKQQMYEEANADKEAINQAYKDQIRGAEVRKQKEREKKPVVVSDFIKNSDNLFNIYGLYNMESGPGLFLYIGKNTAFEVHIFINIEDASDKREMSIFNGKILKEIARSYSGQIENKKLSKILNEYYEN